MVRVVCGVIAVITSLAMLVPLAVADQTAGGGTVAVVTPPSRISPSDPLNGGFLLLNMHGMLFHPDINDISEDLSYARWLGGGIIRVFATDSSGNTKWDGKRVGNRIVEIAPMLRAAHLRLVVAFVNNHQAVPGEQPTSIGWMDNYIQLLLPFYTSTWKGAYAQFTHDLVTTVQAANASDVIFAWELGNELHTPAQPEAIIPFLTQAVANLRQLDPLTPILPGTMGANHVQPFHPTSPIAKWLYCEAPVDAYTLHAYDWVSRQRAGDMPINWDLDNVVSQPCDNGRHLPVIIEELGTSRALPGVYTADDEDGRIQQEQNQIAFVRQFPQVVGFGVWNAESPRLVDRTFVDTRRGLTSYGSRSMGGGSCYDPRPDPAPGARCQLEQILRGTRFVRVAASSTWAPLPPSSAPAAAIVLSDPTTSGDPDPAPAAPVAPAPLAGQVDPVSGGDLAATTLTLNGWLADPATGGSTGIDALDLYIGGDPTSGTRLASATLGLPRSDTGAGIAPSGVDWSNAGFSFSVPLDGLAPGPNQLTLAARTHEHGTWLSTLAVVTPSLGTIPPPPVVAVAPAPLATSLPSLRAEVESPQPNDQVGRTFILQVLAPNADHIDVFLEPDRDNGGRLIGSATIPPGKGSDGPVQISVSAPLDGHTLYVHVTSSTLGQQQLLTVPIIVRS